MADIGCDYIGIKFEYEISSELKINFSQINEPDDWAKCICHALGYTHCVNPIGGKHLYDINEYKKEGIDLCFLTSNITSYEQKNGSFTKALSIIDVMMFNSPETIWDMLDDVSIHRK